MEDEKRQIVFIKKLPRLYEQVRALRKKVEKLLPSAKEKER